MDIITVWINFVLELIVILCPGFPLRSTQYPVSADCAYICNTELKYQTKPVQPVGKETNRFPFVAVTSV